jgi:Fur family ferric uptake transcriptional regulator
MTVSHHHPDPRPVPDVEAALSVVRASGQRASAARRVILEGLFSAGRPVTAEELAGGLQGRLPSTDLASVYRGLEALEALGLVTHFHIGHSPGFYACAGHAHELVACERCGARASVDPALLDPLRDLVRRAVGFEVRFGHFPLVGMCPHCSHDVEHHHAHS